ncbi:hypothetical protein RAG82_25565 [Klebsiella pneumoniae]
MTKQEWILRLRRCTSQETLERIDEVKHIAELDALTLMHEWSKLKKENADLYDYNRQVNRGWRGFILRLMGIHLPEKKRVCLYGINARKESIYPD